MIPKIIHYCWFGGAPLSRETEKYMDTWRACCPGYEIRRWDESSFDVNCCAYTSEAYAAKKWAFLTDYVRLWALEQYGGIYMDTDVELLKPLDEFLTEPAFCGFEREEQLSTALIGSEPHGRWVQMLLEDYKDRHFLRPDGTPDETTNVQVISAATRDRCGIVMNGQAQKAEGLISVYPRDWFSPMTFYTGQGRPTENTRAIHHFVASWHDEQWQRERDTRYACIRLLGESLGERVANAVNALRRRDGSFTQGVMYYLRLPLVKFFACLPLGDILVFETEGDFCDNGRALYEYMLERGLERKYKLIWLVQEPEKLTAHRRDHVRFLRRDSLTARYYISRAKLFFFTHPYWLRRWRPGQTVVNLWHGVPLKGSSGKDMRKCYDYLCISSAKAAWLYDRFLGVDESQVLPLGQPRLDLLYRTRDVSALLGGRQAGRDYDKFLLSMPTFRQTVRWTDGAFANAFSINPVQTLTQLSELNAFLREKRMLLVCKIHHLQKTDFLEQTSLSNILYLKDEDLTAADVQLYELLARADCLLTDYSSVYYDYLLLNRPIGFFVGDMDQYTRGFIMDDPLDWMPGEKIADLAGLYAFLADVSDGRDGYGPDRQRVLARIDDHRDGNNCRRIVEHFGL